MRVCSSVLIASLLLPSLAVAQEAPSPQVVTYPPGDDKIVVVHKGDAAPFTGQLYDDSTAVRWAVWLQQYKGRYAIDMKTAEEVCSVKLSTAEKLATIAAERDAAVHADAMQRLKDSETARLKAEEELRHPGFFDRPAVWFAIGVVATVAVTASTAYLVNAVSK
jgi:hypothetical protein